MTLRECRRAVDLGEIGCSTGIRIHQCRVLCPFGYTHLVVGSIETLILRLTHDRWLEEDREAAELPVSVGDFLYTGARQNIARPRVHR